MIITVVVILIIISIVWAFWSLRGILHAQQDSDQVRKELSKKKIVYQSDSVSSSSEE